MERPPTTRREFLKASAVVALAGAGVVPARAAADPSRIALVVGNNGYRDAPLGNAVNDAKAVAALLERAGFSVTLKTDIDRDALREAATSFGALARGGDAKQVFFFYAGHGVQLEWRNYLLPVDAQVSGAADLPAQCLELGTLLSDFSKAKGKTFVVILDACRDNPFGAAYRPAQRGLSQFDAPPGSLLAFSTAPGSVAADGTGVNGLYTENLVRELSVKGVKIEDALKRVRLSVRVASRGAQIPWESTSLEHDVFVFPTGSGKMSEAEIEVDYQREIALWNRTKGSKQPEDWVGYLREYPSGKFSEIAQSRLAFLIRAEEERLALAKPVVVATAPAPVVAASPPQTAPAPIVAAVPAAPSTPPTAAVVAAKAAPVSGGKPQLEIGPGLPVPVLMRASPNPSSAGTYVNFKVFTVGDEYVIRSSDLIFGGSVEMVTQRVTGVDEESDRIEINGGHTIFDSMGNLIKLGNRVYEPRAQTMPSELQIGNRWTTRFRLTIDNTPSESYYDYRVVSREKVRVPAGEFDAFLVEGTGFGITNGTALLHRMWIVSGFNFPLRSELIRRPRNSVTRNGELRELVSCRQMRWSVA